MNLADMVKQAAQRFFTLPVSVSGPQGYSLEVQDIKFGNGLTFKIAVKEKASGYTISTSDISVSFDEVKLWFAAMQQSNAPNPAEILTAVFDMAKGLMSLALLGAAAKDKKGNGKDNSSK